MIWGQFKTMRALTSSVVRDLGSIRSSPEMSLPQGEDMVLGKGRTLPASTLPMVCARLLGKRGSWVQKGDRGTTQCVWGKGERIKWFEVMHDAGQNMA